MQQLDSWTSHTAVEQLLSAAAEVLVGSRVEKGVGGGMDQVGIVQHRVHRHQSDDHQEGGHVGRQKCNCHQEEYGCCLDVSPVWLLVNLGLCACSSGVGGGGVCGDL